MRGWGSVRRREGEYFTGHHHRGLALPSRRAASSALWSRAAGEPSATTESPLIPSTTDCPFGWTITPRTVIFETRRAGEPCRSDDHPVTA